MPSVLEVIYCNDQVAFAKLIPLFDVCTPASKLNDEGKLWTVVLVKLNGKVL